VIGLGWKKLAAATGSPPVVMVARQTAVTVETSHKYLGQPADYASDTGSQLSVLVVLDMLTLKTDPCQ
jgi:hypothetical protein